MSDYERAARAAAAKARQAGFDMRGGSMLRSGAWESTLYWRGERAGSVENDGHGGDTLVRWTRPEVRDAWERLLSYDERDAALAMMGDEA